ncbi:MAG: preprotein translocase subunit YajC [bacterium]|nr:preprotein translocase subunit YajC [bacterium]
MYLFGQEAGGAGQPGAGGMLGMLLPFILIFVIFYFIIIRPAKKKQNQHSAMLMALKGGERVVTSGGIYGTILRVMDDRFEVEVSKGTKIQISKSSVSTVVDPQSSGGGEKE